MAGNKYQSGKVFAKELGQSGVANENNGKEKITSPKIEDQMTRRKNQSFNARKVKKDSIQETTKKSHEAEESVSVSGALRLKMTYDSGVLFDLESGEETSSKKRVDKKKKAQKEHNSEKSRQRGLHTEEDFQPENSEVFSFRHNLKKLQARKGYEQAHGTIYSRSGKLHFDDERNGTIYGTGTRILRDATGFISMAATNYAADMLSDETDDSAGSDVLEMGSRFVSRSVNVAFNGSINRNRLEKRYRLQSGRGRDTFFYDTEPLSARMNHFWQKKRYKDAYREASGTLRATEKITAMAADL